MFNKATQNTHLENASPSSIASKKFNSLDNVKCFDVGFLHPQQASLPSMNPARQKNWNATTPNKQYSQAYGQSSANDAGLLFYLPTDSDMPSSLETAAASSPLAPPPHNTSTTSSQLDEASEEMEDFSESNNLPQKPIPHSRPIKKRKRLNISEAKFLMEAFRKNIKPNSEQRSQIAQTVKMSDRAVQVWFQNRRAKVKKESSPTMLNECGYEAQNESSGYKRSIGGNFYIPQAPLPSFQQYGNVSVSNEVSGTLQQQQQQHFYNNNGHQPQQANWNWHVEYQNSNAKRKSMVPPHTAAALANRSSHHSIPTPESPVFHYPLAAAVKQPQQPACARVQPDGMDNLEDAFDQYIELNTASSQHVIDFNGASPGDEVKFDFENHFNFKV